LEDAWAAVNEAQKNLLAMERGLMAKFGQFLEPEYNEYDNDETPPVEQSNSKGKNIDPRNWGEVDLDEEIDAEMQKALLEEAADNNHNNESVEFDELQAERQRLEGVRNEIQTLYEKYKRSSRRDTTPLSKDMEKLIEDASGGRHAPTEPSSLPRKEKRGDKTPVLRASNQIAPDSYLGDILGRKKRPSSRRRRHTDKYDSGDSSDPSDSDPSSSDSDSESSDSEDSDSENHHRRKKKIKYKPLTPTTPDKYGGEADPLKFYHYVTQCERLCREAGLPKRDQVAKCADSLTGKAFKLYIVMCRLWPEARSRAKPSQKKPGLTFGLSWLLAWPGI
jgi:hypothetical protein